MDRLLASTAPRGRTLGLVYLGYFATVILASVLAKGLIVLGDASATAGNIAAHENLFRASLALGLVSNAIYLALTALLFALLEPVNRPLALIATLLSVTGCAVQVVGGVLELAPLVVAADPASMGALSGAELHAAALLLLKLYARTFDVSLVLFAGFDFLIGYLIARSGFLPSTLGVLMMAAGVGWLAYLWPPLGAALALIVQPLGFLAEFALMLWLIVKGVDAAGWQRLARSQRVP